MLKKYVRRAQKYRGQPSRVSVRVRNGQTGVSFSSKYLSGSNSGDRNDENNDAGNMAKKMAQGDRDTTATTVVAGGGTSLVILATATSGVG